MDDERMITALLNTDSFSIKGIFFPHGAYYYRPLISLSFIFDKYAWGLHESFMHLENILLHAASTVLVFAAAWQLRQKWYPQLSQGIPFAAALFFAIHPIATESVNWISGRTDLLSGLFLFLGLYLLLLGANRASVGAIAAGALSFSLACLSKDSAIAAFPAFLLIAAAALRGNAQKGVRLVAFLCFTGSAAGYFLLRRLATAGHDTGISGVAGAVSGGGYQLVDKARIVTKVLGFYAKKLFVPWPLNFAILNVSNAYVVAGIAVLLLSLLFLFSRGMSSKLLLLAASTVVPALILPLAGLTWTPIGERYVYMSSGPFCIAMAFVAADAGRRCARPQLLVGCAVLLAALFAGSTLQRTLVWQSNLAFFRDAVKKTPDFAPLKNELAGALEKAGKKEEAKAMYASNILPNSEKFSIVTDLNRARALAEQGKPEQGRELLLAKRYDKSKPLYAQYLEMLIAVDEKVLLEPGFQGHAGVEKEVRDSLLELADLSGDPFLYYRLGKKFMALGMKAQAARYFTLAYQKSGEGAFFRKPAKTLAEKCSRTDG